MQVGLDRQVLSYITAELVKNPRVEEGGKYVGYRPRQLLRIELPTRRRQRW